MGWLVAWYNLLGFADGTATHEAWYDDQDISTEEPADLDCGQEFSLLVLSDPPKPKESEKTVHGPAF